MKPLRPCQHNQQAKADGRFLVAFPNARNPELVGYCWVCGALKRDGLRWQYPLREERIRKSWKSVAKAAQKGRKRG